MDDGELVGRGRLDHLADPDDVRALVGRQPQPERLGLGDHVEHPAVRDVDRHGAEMRDLDRRIQVGREGRHVPERHAEHLAVEAVGGDPDQAGRRFERQVGHGLGHRQHAGLEQDRGDAHRVRPGHARVLDLLHDHVAGIRRRVAGWQDQVAVGRRVAARLAEHPQAQVVAVGLEPGHLVEHRRARDVLDAADDDPARLAGRVRVDRPDDRPEPERWLPCLRGVHVHPYRPRCASAISRAMSRRDSRSAMSRRRSWSCLPRASASSSFARPRGLM